MIKQVERYVPELRTGKASVYARTLELTQIGEKTLSKVDELSLVSDQLSVELIGMVHDYSSSDGRTGGLDTIIIDFFMHHGLMVGDALEILKETVKWLLASPATRPGPVITEGMALAYGGPQVPSTLGHGKGLGVDPLVTRLDQARGGVLYNLHTLDDTFPFVEALLHLFTSRGLTIREAMAVIAQTESALLNAPVK